MPSRWCSRLDADIGCLDYTLFFFTPHPPIPAALQSWGETSSYSRPNLCPCHRTRGGRALYIGVRYLCLSEQRRSQAPFVVLIKSYTQTVSFTGHNHLFFHLTPPLSLRLFVTKDPSDVLTYFWCIWWLLMFFNAYFVHTFPLP